jgi:hypothetical protein
MTAEAGFPFAVTVDDAAAAPQVLSTAINSLQFATPRGVQDITAVSMSAIARQLLLADFSVTFSIAAFDDGANLTHAVFKTVSSSSVARTTTLAISGQSIAPEVLYTDYQLNRGSDGSLTSSVPGVLANGVVPTWS